MGIIGISGKIGVGKTTIAQHITSLLKDWQIMSFADRIKQETAREYDFDPALAYSKAGKETVIKLSDGGRKTVPRTASVLRHGRSTRRGQGSLGASHGAEFDDCQRQDSRRHH